jgi:hypothetical protein
MRADWTRRDDEITAGAGAAGPQRRAGVCCCCGPAMEPLLLPEILTAGLVREALATLQP